MAKARKKASGGATYAVNEGALFSAAETAPTSSPVLVLTSNFTVGPLFARGCLIPESFEGDSLAPKTPCAGLQWSVGRIPADRVEAVVGSARNVIPIAIQLLPGRSVRSVRMMGSSYPVECVSVSDVERLFFRDEREQTRFESLEFGNYDLEQSGIARGVDSGIFETSETAMTAETKNDSNLEASGSSTSHGLDCAASGAAGSAVSTVREADCRAGLLAFLLVGSPGRRAWMRGVQRVFQHGRKKEQKGRAVSWPELISAVCIGTARHGMSSDEVLLKAVVKVLKQRPVENGWPAVQVLADVVEAIEESGVLLDERAEHELKVWTKRAREILESRAEPQSLADDAFVLQRAILLLLLRGGLEELLEGNSLREEALRPGPQVFGAACALAAYRAGLRALPARCKVATDKTAPGTLLAYLGDAFIAMLGEAEPRGLVPSSSPQPVIDYRSIRTLQGEWITSISSREVARTVAEFDSGLERLMTFGRHLGFSFQEHEEDTLVTQVRKTTGTMQPVYLQLLYPEKLGGAVVRFSTPALKPADASRSRFTREFLFELLKRNASPAMNCRFAIIDAEKVEVVVVVDQLLSTLDEAELKQHIYHVADIAEDFAKSQAPTPAPST